MAQTDYELQRARRIAENKAKLAELQLPQLAEELAARERNAPTKQKRAKVSGSGEEPSRRSSRSTAAETKRRLSKASAAQDVDDDAAEGDSDESPESSEDDTGEGDDDGDSDSVSVVEEQEEEEEEQHAARASTGQKATTSTGDRAPADKAAPSGKAAKGAGKGAKAAASSKPKDGQAAAQTDFLAEIDVGEVFATISQGRPRITFEDLKRVVEAHSFLWTDDQIRDMLLDLTDTEGIFDDGTPAEELWLSRGGFEDLHKALRATKKGGGKVGKKKQDEGA